jgi:peptidoglycan/xylan/chitin deacetylase (PgdA/CDA1 family)
MQIGRSMGLAAAGILVAGAATTAAVLLARRPEDGDAVILPMPDEPTPTSTPTPIATPTPAASPTSASPTPDPVVTTTLPVPTVTLEPTPVGTATPIPRDPGGAIQLVGYHGPTTHYTVVAGDTVSAIARRLRTTVDVIAQLNHLADPGRIRVGQVLIVPKTRNTPATPAPTPPPATHPTPAPAPHGSSSQPKVPAGPAISSVRGAKGKVALTFDDGPNGAYTDAVLATLKRHHVKATFFVIGQQAAHDGARLVKMRDAGHAIGNHSWSHPQLTSLSDSQVKQQLADTSAAIKRATGSSPDIFRAPYGARSTRVDAVGRQLGMRDIIWDVDTRDWSMPGSAAIVREAVGSARDGSVILMHDGGGNRQQTVDALDRVITGLQGRGFELVTVPQLVQSGN